MRRWVRYEAPIMVCVELGDDGYTGKVVNVVLGDEHDDLNLARDYRGHFLIYDETMERVSVDERAATRAVTIAEHREWPDRLDWDEGPDALRYPDLYDPAAPDTDGDEDDDLEPLDLHDRDIVG
ncbi:hypothetical protein B0E53_02017 [Micromonospora sp. MH33]|uniref:hypothetical protein n=1 Tax=Micromonospora sp. MH33 TaxID=1945509 RepID=UPI000D14A55D|nr:hypothetical protein [Micromonospora sp. MH33]PSK66037.1 hypothetical protein B0E53_02017 [Micromonospora sp. MH33]